MYNIFKSALYLSLLTVILCCSLPAVAQEDIFPANPSPSWNAFKDAAFSDIYMTPSLANGVNKYTLILGLNPTLTVDGVKYSLNAVKGFFIVSKDGTTFTAPGKTNGSWAWDEKKSGSKWTVAGWSTKSQLKAHDQVDFTYDGLSYASDSVTIGLMVDSAAPGGSFRGTLAAQPALIPEPSAFVGLAGMIAASLAGLKLRKSY